METLKDWLTRPEGLATRLRALRAQAGLSGKELADAHGWQQSKVSRIESGEQRAKPADIEAWARTCGADDAAARDLLHLHDEAQIWHATFKSRMARGQTAVQKSYSDLARTSDLIRHFETTFVPGPLQVPEYAHAILSAMKELHGTIDDVDAAVGERMQRTQMLYDPAKRWEFLLAEPVLRWLLCPPTVMRTQLDRLQTVIGLERVRFGIIPMGVELAMAPQNTVEVYTGTAETIAVAETFIGETWFRDDEALAYDRALDQQWEDAAEGDAARELIARAIRALPEAT